MELVRHMKQNAVTPSGAAQQALTPGRRVLAAGAALLTAAGLLAGGAAQATAGPGSRVAHLPPLAAHVRLLPPARTGKPAGLVPPRHQPPVPQAAGGNRPDPGNMGYYGGPVQHHPKVYLVFWGNWWANTSNPRGHGIDVENYLYDYFANLGYNPTDSWSPIMSQYRDGSGGPVFGKGGIFCGDNCWVVLGGSPPKAATNAQIAAAAASMADFFGVAGNPDAQIVVVSPAGRNPGGCFIPYAPGTCKPPAGSGAYCAWHNRTIDGSGKFVAYINLPYLLDAGANCGKNAVQSPLDGFSIVGGHEFAETITDPGAHADPPYSVLGAWYDGPVPPDCGPGIATCGDGEEIADKCAWYHLFSQTLVIGESFAQQPLWDNSRSTCSQAAVTLARPGHQVATVGTPVALQLHASDVITSPHFKYTATGLPRGLSLNSSTGRISGTPRAGGTHLVSVGVTDRNGVSASTSFRWTIIGIG